MTRSQFLMAGAALAIPVMAAELSTIEKENLVLVADFCAAFAERDMTKIASFMAPNCSYRITETAMPAVGAAAVERIKSYVERSSKIEFKILDSWARGPIVINERIDSFTRTDGSPAYHLVGVFLIKDGKIAEWTDLRDSRLMGSFGVLKLSGLIGFRAKMGSFGEIDIQGLAV